MAKKFGDWRFAVGDIVEFEPSGAVSCSRDGVVELDDQGRAQDTLNTTAVCYVVAREPNPHDALFARVDVYDNRYVAKKTRAYLLQVVPELGVQPSGFFQPKLGRYFLAREDRLSRGTKEKRLQGLALYDFAAQVFDKKRLATFKNKVHEDKMSEGGARHVDDR